MVNVKFMLIGELAQSSNFSRDTIRFYEKTGLLKSAKKGENNYKDYGVDMLERLSLIQSLKALGFTLNEIKDFISLWDSDSSCENLAEGIQEKLILVDGQIEALKRTREQLLTLSKRCKGKDCEFVQQVPSCLCRAKGCC